MSSLLNLYHRLVLCHIESISLTICRKIFSAFFKIAMLGSNVGDGERWIEYPGMGNFEFRLFTFLFIFVDATFLL